MSVEPTPKEKDKGRGLCLLSLDAGGSRGISQLKILIQAMQRYNDSAQRDRALPCMVFDMIGGVGSGGFIAILLAVFGMTAEEAMEEFIKLSTTILEVKGLDATARTAALSLYIGNLLESHGFSKLSRLMDPNTRSNSCKLVVPISYKRHVGSLCILRNYAVRQEQTIDVTISKALMATLATPPLFTSVSVFKDAATFEYVGGDIALANPIRDVITEAHGTFGPEEQVGCLLSLGCGDPRVVSIPNDSSLTTWNTFLSRLATDSEKLARLSASQMGHLELYFRLSVNRGLEVSSDVDTANPGDIITQTLAYLEDGSVVEKMENLIELLKLRHGTSSLEQLKRSGGEKILQLPLPSSVDAFVMRHESWDFIEHRMLDGATGRTGTLVVTGMGGCGKTQIIRKFVEVSGPRFPSVFFIDASSELRLKEDIRQHVRALGPEYSQMTFRDCLSFLAQPIANAPRLLVYDNLDDTELDILPHLPAGDNCAIIITSRNHSMGELSPQGHLELDVMSEDEAIEVVLHGLTHISQPAEEVREGARGIAQVLGFLPIALTQARSYMSQTKCSATVYLQLLNRNRDKLLARPVKHERDMRYTSTYAAFGASFDMLAKRNQMFLRLLSFFHWVKFPLELLLQAASSDFSSYWRVYADHGDGSNSGKEMLQHIFQQNGQFDTIDLHDMTIALQNYSLASLNSGVNITLLQMHPLIHNWIHSGIEESDQGQYQSAAVLLLALGSQKEYTPSSPYLASHVIHLTPIWDHLNLNDAGAFGVILNEAGMFSGALQLQERVVRELTHLEPPGQSEPLASSLMRLARTYRGLGRLNEAQAHQQQVIIIRRHLFGDCHPETLDAENNLAVMYQEMGRLSEAEQLMKDVLEKSTRELGERHIDTIRVSSNLSTIYRDQDRLPETQALQEEVLRLRQSILGRRHPDTLGASINLATTYCNLDRFEDAEALQLETMRDTTEILGERHPVTLTAMYNLAVTYLCQGRLVDAEMLQTEVISRRRGLWGDQHPGTLSASNHLAMCYLQQGRLPEAEVLLTGVLRQRRVLLGNSHPDTVKTLFILISTFITASQFTRALPYQRDLYRIRVEELGEQHPDSITACDHLVVISFQAGQLAEAKTLQEIAMRNKKALLGEQHPDVIAAYSLMAALYQMTGSLEEALEFQLLVLRLRKETLPEGDSDVIAAYDALISTYVLLHRFVEAEVVQKEVLYLLDRSLGANSPQTIGAMGRLIVTQRGLGKHEEVQVLQTELLKRQKETIGERHTDTTTNMLDLAETCLLLGKRTMTLYLLTKAESILSETGGREHVDYLRCQEMISRI